MDSSIDCMVFALNAIGNCVSPADFRDVRDKEALRAIHLNDVIGDDPLLVMQRTFRAFKNIFRNTKRPSNKSGTKTTYQNIERGDSRRSWDRGSTLETATSSHDDPKRFSIHYQPLRALA